MKTDIFEVCAGSVQDCINAQIGGADRIELNSALYLGGLTPSLAMLKLVKEKINLKAKDLLKELLLLLSGMSLLNVANM